VATGFDVDERIFNKLWLTVIVALCMMGEREQAIQLCNNGCVGLDAGYEWLDGCQLLTVELQFQPKHLFLSTEYFLFILF
jgi:hypothetical protein